MKNTRENSFENNKKIVDDNILISVIIPVYNSESYLSTCLQSVINQTYRNLEIICIDDGSSDHSLDILDFYSQKDSRIKVIRQKNSGPSVARNKGLDNASGDYISFVDSDDYLQLNAYEILVECALQKEKWDLIFFGGNVIGDSNNYINQKLSPEFRKYTNCKPGEVIFHERSSRPFLWLHFIKRSLIEKPFRLRFDNDLELGEDQLFQFGYVPRAKNVMVIDLKLYNYRIQHNASLMQLYNDKRITKANIHFSICNKVLNLWKENNLYKLYKDDLWTWIVEFIYWTIVDLPLEFRKEYANKVITKISEENAEYLISELEKKHLSEMKLWSVDDMTDEDKLHELIVKTEREQFEIEETLKSKAFKLGKLLTPHKDRLSLD